jgi:hypothetical protein
VPLLRGLAVPTATELATAFGVPLARAYNAWRILRTAALMIDDAEAGTGILVARRALAGASAFLVGARGPWALRFILGGAEDLTDYDEVGQYVGTDPILAYLDGDYLKDHEEYDPASRKWRPAPRPEGFHVTTLEREQGAWEDWRQRNETPEEVEARGPQDDGTDLWTDDACHFHEFRYGTTHDRIAFRAGAQTLPEALQGRIEALEEQIDEETDGRRLAALEKLQERLRERRDALDNPWEGSSNAWEEMSRPGIWWLLHRYQTKVGFFGNVWFRAGASRRRGGWEWWLCRPPPNYRYWQRAQSWRPGARSRASALRAMQRAVGAVPAPGDLWTDHLYAKMPWGVNLYVVGEPGMIAFRVIPRSEIVSGRGYSAIAWALREQSARIGREARFWSAPSWYSDPTTWALVDPDAGGPSLGALRAPRRRRVRGRRRAA